MIPLHYILKRWTRDAKGRSITNYHGGRPNDNPKESVGKRYGHLCHNFHEISSFAAEHEKLTTYVHKCSVELLKSLEQIKKNLFLNSTCVNQSSQGQALFDGNCENEQVAMKTLQNSEITKPRGIKTKPTMGRPRSRLKGVLERRKPQTKATKTKTTKQLSMKDCTPRGNAKEQQVVQNEIPMFNGLTRDTNFNEISMVNANTNFVATTIMQDKMLCTQQLQGSYIGNGTQVPCSRNYFAPTTTLQYYMPFIEQFQESLMFSNDLS
ncbi:hypothetical protein Q3G72_013948 [Acer saccharum]|nr:hypothetical protein Q3G72_013948 [Acer saccharum]